MRHNGLNLKTAGVYGPGNSTYRLKDPARDKRNRTQLGLAILFIFVIFLLAGCTPAEQHADDELYANPPKPIKQCSKEIHTWKDKRDCDQERVAKVVANHRDAVFPPIYIPTVDISDYIRH